GVWRDRSGDDADHRRLPGAVLAEQRVERARGDAQVAVGESGRRAEALLKPTQLENRRRAGHRSAIPPSTSTVAPVIALASSESRNRTVWATSSCSISRPSGTPARALSRRPSGHAVVIPVSMGPGATAFTRTPRGIAASASDLVRP